MRNLLRKLFGREPIRPFPGWRLKVFWRGHWKETHVIGRDSARPQPGLCILIRRTDPWSQYYDVTALRN